MSPILIRPVREQIEHDRIIRVLHARLRKDFDVEANVGDDRRATLRVGPRTHHPDLLLTAPGAPRKVQGVVEVETGESVNHLEAMAEWAHFGKTKAPFHLYVPVSAVDIARRLVDDYHVSVAQLWSYATVGDHVHFWLVHATGEGAPLPGTEYKLPVDAGYTPPKPEPVSEPAPTPAELLPVAKPKAEPAAKAGKVAVPAPAKPAPAKPAPAKPAPAKPAPAKPAPAKPAPAKPAPKVAGKPVKAPPPTPVKATKAVPPAKVAKPSKAITSSKPGSPHQAASAARSSKAKKPVKKVAPRAAPKRLAKAASKPSAKKGTVKKRTSAKPVRAAKAPKRR